MAKKITTKQIKDIISANNGDNPKVQSVFVQDSNGQNVAITVKHLLSLSEMTALVDNVVDTCFIEDQYIPAVEAIAQNTAILLYYTNISQTINGDMVMELLCNSTIMENIRDKINCYQLDMINKAIEAGIDYRKQLILSQCKRELNECISIIQQNADIISSFGEQVGNLNIQDMAETMKAIANKNEDQIANSVLTHVQQKIEDGKIVQMSDISKNNG